MSVAAPETLPYGARVAAARERLGLSLRLLGAKVDASSTHLFDVEHGRRSPSPALRQRLDAVLGLES
jgi:ribosome-binding protein aMBF1 (putative translation factor)